MCASVCIIDGDGANGDSKMEEEEESEKYCNIELKAAAVVSFPTQGHKFPMPKQYAVSATDGRVYRPIAAYSGL